jgi:hypothetical protein
MIYHYTYFIQDIMEDQCLKPWNKNNNHTRFFNNEKECVWFTRSPIPEPTMSIIAGLPLYRIVCEDSVATITWQQYKRAPKKFLLAMQKIANASGTHIADWRMTYEEVPSAQWVGIELI